MNLWTFSLSPRTFRRTGALQKITSGTGLEDNPWPGPDGKVAYWSGSANEDIWSLPIDANRGMATGEPRRLVEQMGLDTDPDISEDGSTLVFASQRSGKCQLWKKDLRTGAETRLSETIARKPLLSPDGRLVAFDGVLKGRRHIHVLDLETGEVRRVDRGEAEAFETAMCFSWTPDGNGLLFRSWDEAKNSYGIGLLKVDSGEISTVYDLAAAEGGLWNERISPDGRWILFNRALMRSSRLAIAPYPSSDPSKDDRLIYLTDGSGIDDKPCWSPDGMRVYFVSHRDGNRCIWSMALTADMKPAEEPRALRHFHGARTSLLQVNIYNQELRIVSGLAVFNMVDLSGNIWMGELSEK